MKEIIQEKQPSVIPYNEVTFTSFNPIGIQSPEGCKLLVRVNVHGLLVLTKLVELNSDHVISFDKSGTWKYTSLSDLLEEALNYNYKPFLFDSWKEFYQWCAE